MGKEYKIKPKNIIPIYGLAEYMYKWPLLDSNEDIKVIKRLTVLTMYNVLFSIGAAFSIAKGLEHLIK
jgi:hypothetical protein